MKRLLAALFLVLLPLVALAQPINVITPRPTDYIKIESPRFVYDSFAPISAIGALIGNAPCGTNGQIQFNNAGICGSFTLGGDASLNSVTGALTIVNAAIAGPKLAPGAAVYNLGFTPIDVATRGIANGVPTLDSGGFVPLSQLPPSIAGGLAFQGNWNASTNTPTLVSSTGSPGQYYFVSVAGTTTLNGTSSWAVGDLVLFSSSTWNKIPGPGGGTGVSTVAGLSGAVSGASLISAAGLATSGANTNIASLVGLTGNIALTATGQRFTADMSNATLANRFAFQTNAANSFTSVNAIPSGSGNTTAFVAYSTAGMINGNAAELIQQGTETQIAADKIGTGTYGPLEFLTGGVERARFLANGNFGIAKTSPAYPLDVTGDINTTGSFRVNGTPFSFANIADRLSYFPGASASVATFGTPGLDMSGCTTTASCGWSLFATPTAYPAANVSTLRVDKSAPASGGVSGSTYATMEVNSTTGLNDQGYFWGLRSTLFNRTLATAGAQNVALTATTNKQLNGQPAGTMIGPSWALYAECNDQTSVVNPTGGCGSEIVTYTNVGSGTDAGKQRYAMNFVGGVGNGTDTGVHIGSLVLMSGVNGAVIDAAVRYGNSGGSVFQTGIDFTGGSFTGPVVKMALGQVLSLTATNDRTLSYQSDGFDYRVGGSTVWGISDTGALLTGSVGAQISWTPTVSCFSGSVSGPTATGFATRVRTGGHNTVFWRAKVSFTGQSSCNFLSISAPSTPNSATGFSQTAYDETAGTQMTSTITSGETVIRLRGPSNSATVTTGDVYTSNGWYDE